MKFSLRFLFLLALFLSAVLSIPNAIRAQANGEVESLVGQFTSVPAGISVVVRDMSGDGRFVVVESNGDLATNRTPDTVTISGQVQFGRNNADGNFEIFLFDYGQRRIFQLTNTKRALKNVTESSTTQNNIQVDVLNTRPVISNSPDASGNYWIAFASNAASSVAGNTNPGFFNGNLCTSTVASECNVDANGVNARRTTLTALQADGNLEIFLYRVPAVTLVDLSSGADLPFQDLGIGEFTRVTDTPASLPPLPGSTTQDAIVRDNNTTPSISNDGSVIAFVSNRDVVPTGSIAGQTTGNADANREIFVYLRNAATNRTRQVTLTAPGGIFDQIFNIDPSISGDGRRVAFASSGANPVRGAEGGANPDFNLEVFYANLDAAGEPTGTATERQVQVTRTTRNTPETTVNIFSPGDRISRDGRFIAFETLSANPADPNAAIQTTGYAVYVYDAASTTTTRYRQYGARSFEDPIAAGGDFRRYPTFTQSDDGANAPTLVFTSRINYKTDGTVGLTAGEGMNQNINRPVQIYSTPLDLSTGTSTTAAVNLSRLTRTPTLSFSDLQPFTSNTRRRMAFNHAVDFGGENVDLGFEGFYLISPNNALITTPAFSLERFQTGASARPVGSPAPVPSPSVSPSASPTPTPISPNAVPALSRGMLAIANLPYTRPRSAIVAGGASTMTRSFELPIELQNVTVNVNGAAAGIAALDGRQVFFIVPKGLRAGTYTVTVNDNGRVSRRSLNIVASQPDVFNNNPVPSVGGRARIFNSTNPPRLLGEPFYVRTIRNRPYGNVPTRVRLFLTGVRGLAAADFSIRIRDRTISGAQILTGAVETDQPGVYTVDFLLPAELAGAGDVPIVVTTTGSVSSLLDDLAPRLRIL